MNRDNPPHQDEAWGADWASAREHKLTMGLAVTPAQRLAWLEEVILFAHRAGALPRARLSPDDPWHEHGT
jgi:hypothetical protein